METLFYKIRRFVRFKKITFLPRVRREKPQRKLGRYEGNSCFSTVRMKIRFLSTILTNVWRDRGKHKHEKLAPVSQNCWITSEFSHNFSWILTEFFRIFKFFRKFKNQNFFKCFKNYANSIVKIRLLHYMYLTSFQQGIQRYHQKLKKNICKCPKISLILL